jgi:hypothetical protein
MAELLVKFAEDDEGEDELFDESAFAGGARTLGLAVGV